MKEVVLITGHNGSLAKKAKALLSTSYEVRTLTTKLKDVDNNFTFHWNINKNYLDRKSLQNCNHIVLSETTQSQLRCWGGLLL